MTVNVSILVERAKAFSKKYGVPITKNQFEGTLDDPVPELPYMVWLTALIMAGASVVAYIIGEGLTDAANVETEVEVTTEEEV